MWLIGVLRHRVNTERRHPGHSTVASRMTSLLYAIQLRNWFKLASNHTGVWKRSSTAKCGRFAGKRTHNSSRASSGVDNSLPLCQLRPRREKLHSVCDSAWRRCRLDGRAQCDSTGWTNCWRCGVGVATDAAAVTTPVWARDWLIDGRRDAMDRRRFPLPLDLQHVRRRSVIRAGGKFWYWSVTWLTSCSCDVIIKSFVIVKRRSTTRVVSGVNCLPVACFQGFNPGWKNLTRKCQIAWLSPCTTCNSPTPVGEISQINPCLH